MKKRDYLKVDEKTERMLKSVLGELETGALEGGVEEAYWFILSLFSTNKKLTSDNSDYATASPKLPSLRAVSDYIGYMPDETMTIQATYNAIKKLGNFA